RSYDLDKKADSAWSSAMKNAAKSSKHHRDPLYAQAMADASLDFPEYGAKEGELLTLTASDAEKVGYSEGTMESFEELLAHLNLQNAKVIEMKETATENIARFITNPIVVPDRKSTRLNSSHVSISYAVFCLKKKK